MYDGEHCQHVLQTCNSSKYGPRHNPLQTFYEPVACSNVKSLLNWNLPKSVMSTLLILSANPFNFYKEYGIKTDILWAKLQKDSSTQMDIMGSKVLV